IAHTRWATHGRPSVENAHPHQVGAVTLVHNGIIENYQELKAQLLNSGYSFKSSTDTEVLASLIDSCYQKQEKHGAQGELSLEQLNYQALSCALSLVKGSYAIAVIFDNDHDHIYIAKEGSPLVLGLGIGENFVASDVLALTSVTSRFIYLQDGDRGIVGRNDYQLFDSHDKAVTREVNSLEHSSELLGKGPYKHYMQKEIFEQTDALVNTMMGRLKDSDIDEDSFIANHDKVKCSFTELLKDIDHLEIVACGTSYHAALVGKYLIEQYAEISVNVSIASEYRYKKTIVPSNSLFVTISQSGETADTLAALKLAKTQNYLASLCICNVANSSLVRESDYSLLTRAGTEIGVASTKAFTTQLLCFNLLTIALGRAHNHIDKEQAQSLIADLKSIPNLISEVLKLDKVIETLAQDFVSLDHSLFLGRGMMYPIALEGALKLKEISYIHAEGYASGELKHGPIALIDSHMPVIVVAPDNKLLPKLISNIQEVSARGGKLYIFTDTTVKLEVDDKHLKVFTLPHSPDFISALVFTIPLQLLAYHVALIKGSDVDQPRNLAKSVTVE
ncbi:glutamine--fructose-6-phosphate transaminase (isomerizing), partial [Anaerobiospirillum succiniciproducens]|uniref:glutamine--fructose-6-phosphate transaminase (isomerizing) n=1 Tax=Anaerobiospirillum succiniciproducens TaxID=13335 RepID=UPI00248EF54B